LTSHPAAESFRTLTHPHNKIERSLIKILAWTFGVLLFLIVGGVLGYKQFHRWQERRLVAQANALVDQNDVKRASLDARRILQINPDSAPGCRIMARIAEKAGSRSAIEWRRRVVDLEPGNVTDLIGLARAAIRFNDGLAREFALSRIPESAKATTEYHALAADLAVQKRDSTQTEAHLREAVRLDPSNKDNQLRLASLQLNSNDAATRNEARATLLQLQKDALVRRPATRALAEDALRRGEFADAITYTRQLDSYPEKTFEDRVLLLSALHRSFDPGATPLLQELQASALQNPDHVGALIAWLTAHQMPIAAISWGSRLPPEMLGNKAVALALADSYIAARDWEGMQRLVKTGNWGGLDFLRNGLAMRAAREQGNEPESATHWAEAIKKVSTAPKQAITLAEVFERWGWQKEVIELLWIAAKDPVLGDDALQALYNFYAKRGATHDLYRVLMRREELRPDDYNVKNNIAVLSLLLNMNVDRAQRLARELHEREPKNPVFTSTYAFALHSKGDTKKALAVMNTLTPQQLQQPEIATYYGILLAAAGEHAKAAEYLDASEKAGLLPEEKALVDKARRTLAQR
jgi:lipopolysaccharide biosynthesis regulator YciM